MKDKVLYKIDSKGKIRYWKIFKDINGLHMKYGVLDGEPIFDSEIINYGLAGRTQDEQIELRFQSRINKKVDSGYCHSIEDAESSKGKNALGLLKPMLAMPFDKIKDFKFDENFIQRKYDGHRCLIKNDGGELLAYSRNGKIIDTIDHIMDEIKGQIPDGVTVDGELYCHGQKLQTIASWVKRKQENTKRIQYVIYDTFDGSCANFQNRLSHVNYLITESENIKIAETSLLIGEFNIKSLLNSFTNDGYEGLIIRKNKMPYENSKRSKSVIKVKKWLDDEFEVLKITCGVNGEAILHMNNMGVLFKATCHGMQSYKKYVYENSNKFIGRKVNIQYSGLTKDGCPFHPVATMWRDKNEE